jgi:hypothetical protein
MNRREITETQLTPEQQALGDLWNEHVRDEFALKDANAVDPSHILQTGFAFWASKTLLSAVGMEVFTELARVPATVEALQGRLDLHARSARDFFDTLVALGFLTRDEQGVYRNTPSTDFYLDKRKPTYIGGMLEMCNHRLYRFWADLSEGLRTGRPQNEVKYGDPNLFEELYADPARLKEFLRAMTGQSRCANVSIAHKFPWAQYKSVVDVGTAQGDLVTQIALANPHIEGMGFDLPVVGQVFEDYIAHNGLTGRVRFHAGSFFTDPLPKADVVTMGHILHDWDLEEKRLLIRRAYEALPEGGVFIVYDALIDDERRSNAFGLMMSLNMLIETPGGFDYTGADCCGWVRDGGFRETRVQHLVGPDSMVVGLR